jgi:hypothetical protein
MAGRYGDMDYATYAKFGFVLGFLLVAGGASGEIVGRALYGTLPAWENTLFFDIEVVSVFVALLSPLVFGVVLPLTE